MKCLPRLAGLLVMLTACPGGSAEPMHVFNAEQFVYDDLHKPRKYATYEVTEQDCKASRACYQLVDDDTKSGKALAFRLNKQLLWRFTFPVLQTPAIENLSVGTYRVTVRMRMQGMLNSLGTAIAISAGDQTREVWLNEFLEEDAYQEFALDFEVREGDLVTKRDRDYHWHVDAGPGTALSREDLAKVDEALRRNSLPWEQRIALWLAERQLKPRTPEESATWAAALEKLAACGSAAALAKAADGLEKPIQKSFEALLKNVAPPSAVQVRLSVPVNKTGERRTRGLATPEATLRRLYIDWIRVEKLPEPASIVVREVQPRFPWRRPGETQVFQVWMHNRSGRPQQGTLRLTLENGLTDRKVLRAEEISLGHGEYGRRNWSWPIPERQRLWGQTIVAEFVKGEEVLSASRSWFTIHPFSNAVMIAGQNPERFLHPYASSPRTQNHVEYFGANNTPGDAAQVVPDDEGFWEPYVVGNGSFFTSMASMNALVRQAADRGIAPFFYLESHGTSQRAMEIYWDHPEWVSALAVGTDQAMLERQRTAGLWLQWWRDGAKGPQPQVSANCEFYVQLNGLIKQNVDRVIQGTVKYLEHVPWAGIRWDGAPFVASNGKALGGTWGKTQEELKQAAIANVARFREEVRRHAPHFQLRFNGGIASLTQRREDPFDFDQAYAIFDEEGHHKELVKGHGNCMEEYWMGYGKFGTYTNNCRNYLRACHFENAPFKRAGGHNAHMFWAYDGRHDYTPDEIYQFLFTLLGGAHWDGSAGPIPDSMYDLSVYAARFGEFFWDPELRPIARMQEKVSADADANVWVTETGFEKTNERGNPIYVIPVINPPVTETWLRNRFGVLPAPLREPFALTVKVPEKHPEVKDVYLLDNHPHPRVKRLPFETGDGEVIFQIPELVIFKVVVVEFMK